MTITHHEKQHSLHPLRWREALLLLLLSGFAMGSPLRLRDTTWVEAVGQAQFSRFDSEQKHSNKHECVTAAECFECSCDLIIGGANFSICSQLLLVYNLVSHWAVHACGARQFVRFYLEFICNCVCLCVCACMHLFVLRGGGRLIRGAVGHRKAGEEA